MPIKIPHHKNESAALKHRVLPQTSRKGTSIPQHGNPARSIQLFQQDPRSLTSDDVHHLQIGRRLTAEACAAERARSAAKN
jgi:hypothetical protein